MPSLELMQARMVTREADSSALSQLVVQRRQAEQIRRARARQVIETSGAASGQLDNSTTDLRHDSDQQQALSDHFIDKRV